MLRGHKGRKDSYAAVSDWNSALSAICFLSKMT